MGNFFLGDQVELLDSKEKGTIIKKEGNLLIVNIDGFEYEVLDSEVVLIPDLTKKNNPSKIEKQEELQEGFYLLLDIEEHWISIYLLNHTACSLHFIINLQGKTLEYIKDGLLEPFKSQKIKSVSIDTFTRDAKFQVQLLSCYKNNPEKNQFLNIHFEPSQKVLNRKVQYIKNLQKEVIVFPLEVEVQPSKSSAKIPVHLKNKTNTQNFDLCLETDSYLEFDLHIEKLTDKPLLIENPLSFQLKKAEEFLYTAITKKCSKIVFIHGGGKGKLKEELISLLKNHPNVGEHGTADIQKYGLGATYFELKTR